MALLATRTPTLPPATHTNSFAVGQRQVLLIEPASPYDDEQRAWLQWARQLASTGRELVAIVATHSHPDHVGGARLFCRELALPLWAHARCAERIGVEPRQEVHPDLCVALGAGVLASPDRAGQQEQRHENHLELHETPDHRTTLILQGVPVARVKIDPFRPGARNAPNICTRIEGSKNTISPFILPTTSLSWRQAPAR